MSASAYIYLLDVSMRRIVRGRCTMLRAAAVKCTLCPVHIGTLPSAVWTQPSAKQARLHAAARFGPTYGLVRRITNIVAREARGTMFPHRPLVTYSPAYSDSPSRMGLVRSSIPGSTQEQCPSCNPACQAGIYDVSHVTMSHDDQDADHLTC
jgi:hypothetical protein